MRPTALRPTLPLLLALALGACSAFGYPSPVTPPSPVAGSTTAPSARPPGTYEVFGVRYATLSSSDGYREVGVASWYGEDFHGRPTASGESYDMHGLTAAHRSLPLQTCVEVTRVDNGRTVVVRVNDRGPFARTHRRIIDLSYEAARRLEMVGPGVAEVDVRALEPGGC